MTDPYEPAPWFAPPDDAFLEEEEAETTPAVETPIEADGDPGGGAVDASSETAPAREAHDPDGWALEGVIEDAAAYEWEAAPEPAADADDPPWALGDVEAAPDPDDEPAPAFAPAPVTEPEFHTDPEPAFHDEPELALDPPVPVRRSTVVRARVASTAARGVSWAVDGAVVLGIVGVLLWTAGATAGATGGLTAILADGALILQAALLAGLVGAVYTAVAVALGGQTVGGGVAGVRVLDGTGHPPGLLRSAVRGLLAAAGILAFGIGIAWILVDDRGQALHDRLVGTYGVES